METSPKRPLRIAFLTGAFPSLSETFVLNQITGLLDRGHDVDIYPRLLSPAGLRHADVDAYGLLGRTHVEEMPTPPFRRYLGAARLAGRLLLNGSAAPVRALHTRFRETGSRLHLLYDAGATRGRRYDVLYAHFGPNGLRAHRLRRIGALHGALVVTFLGYDLTETSRLRGKQVYEELFADASLCLPCSENGRQQLLALGAPPKRTVVHRLGIDCDRFAFSPRTRPAEGPVRLLSVARLVEKKGIAYGIRAVAALPDDTDVRYDILGDGPLRPELERLVDELDAGERIVLHGWRDTDAVQRAMAEAHALLAPSVTAESGDTEGIPVVLMEAMATGLPVVSTLHAGIPELVTHRHSGYLVPERNVPALSDALARLIRRSETWPDLGRAGRAFVERHHNIRLLNDRLVRRFEALAT